MAEPTKKPEPQKPLETPPNPTTEPNTTKAGLDKNPNRGQSSIPTANEIPVHVGGDG